MKTIYKYQLQITDMQSLKIPANGEILSLQIQHEVPCLWVEVDTNSPDEERNFQFIGTGHPIDPSGAERCFIGNVQLNAGLLVFHLFELKR